jgi:hypothetical protein
MKKTILSIAFICSLGGVTSQAQGLYFSGSVGYGFKAGSTVIGSNNNLDGSSDVVKGSLGTGFTSSLSAGYLFNKNIGAELGLGYLIGSKTTLKSASVNTSGTAKYSANSFYLNPSFVIRAGEGKIVPYGKMGIFLGLGNSGTYDNNTTSITKNKDDKFTYKGGISTGITTAFGAEYKVSDKFAVFGELFGRLASWSPARYTEATTTTTINPGTSTTTASFSVSGDLVKHTPPNYIGSNQSSIVLPFSSIGFNFGVRYYLSK